MREQRACNIQQHVWYTQESECVPLCTVAAVLALQYASVVNIGAELYSRSCEGTFLRRYAVGHRVTEL